MRLLILAWVALVVASASCSPDPTSCSRKCERWRDECGWEDFFDYSCDDGDGCPLEDECPDWSDCEADCYACYLEHEICGEEDDDAIVFDDPRCEEACRCSDTYTSKDVNTCLTVGD